MVLMADPKKSVFPDKLENIRKVNQAARQLQLKKGRHYEAWKAGLKRYLRGSPKRKQIRK